MGVISTKYISKAASFPCLPFPIMCVCVCLFRRPTHPVTGCNEECNTLRPMFDDKSGEENCNRQCEKCNRPFTLSLEWSDKEADMDLLIVEPDGTSIRWNAWDGVSRVPAKLAVNLTSSEA